jgi:uncharacterized tellurite resistance protein B-like protein
MILKKILNIFKRNKEDVKDNEKKENEVPSKELKEVSGIKPSQEQKPSVSIEEINKHLEEHSEKKEELLKIPSKNIDEIISLISDLKLKESAEFAKKLPQMKFNENTVINSGNEAEEFVRQEILEYLKNEYDTIKQRISDLRKHGKEVDLESISLMQVPLKIRIFNSGSSIKDLQTIMDIIKMIDQKIKPLEDLIIKEEAEKLERENEETKKNISGKEVIEEQSKDKKSIKISKEKIELKENPDEKFSS